MIDRQHVFVELGTLGGWTGGKRRRPSSSDAVATVVAADLATTWDARMERGKP
jgi:hypothetical protein